MAFFPILATVAFTVGLVSANGAVIDAYRDTGCRNYSGTFTVPSNGGQCWAEDPNTGITLRSLDPGCTSTSSHDCMHAVLLERLALRQRNSRLLATNRASRASDRILRLKLQHLR